MDLLYSVSLLVAMAAGAAAVVLGAFAVGRNAVPDHAHSATLRIALTRAALWALAIGSLALMTSVTVHRRWGHGPEAAQPMDLARFLSEHQAFAVAGLVLVAGAAVIEYGRRRRTAVPPDRS